MCEVATFNNFENNLTVKVMMKTKVSLFIWDTVYIDADVLMRSHAMSLFARSFCEQACFDSFPVFPLLFLLLFV